MENKTFYEKLIEAKKNMGAIIKDSTNPFFKSKYADLSAILQVVEPALMEQNLILLQPINDGVLKTIITDGKDSVESSYKLGEYTNPQDAGKEITYFRRYLLQSMLGLSAEDNDGNNLSRKPVKKELPFERFNKAIESFKEGKATYESIVAFDLSEWQLKELNDVKKELENGK